MKAIYGKKLGMTRVFTEDGRTVPVTVLEVGPNVVHQVKTAEKCGYDAIQIGVGSRKSQRANKPFTGHAAKAEKGLPRHVAEIRMSRNNGGVDKDGKPESFKVGDEVRIDGMFEIGSRVDVMGTSMGKGFAGVMKRHHMAGFGATHGTHEYFRHGGSIGCRKYPGRVFKNKRMAGRMGGEQVIQLGLEVVGLRPEENVLLVKGSVPGVKDSLVFVRSAVRDRRGAA